MLDRKQQTAEFRPIIMQNLNFVTFICSILSIPLHLYHLLAIYIWISCRAVGAQHRHGARCSGAEIHMHGACCVPSCLATVFRAPCATTTSIYQLRRELETPH
jgi:hypothetical protein